MSHPVLEPKISEDAAQRYMRGFATLLDDIGHAIAEKVPHLTPAVSVDLCIQSYALVIGLWQISASPEACSEAMRRGELQNITVDFERQARLGLSALWSRI